MILEERIVMSKLVDKLKTKYKSRKTEEMSLEEYVSLLKTNPEMYASPAERLLKAIGEPILVDTAKDDRLSRIHRNRVVKVYEAFHDFYGMEEVIEKVVAFFKHAAQGLEEDKQVLYLLGPVGSAKSSLAERLKELMAKEPIYALKGSPIQESPLGLFTAEDAEELGVPERYLRFRASPWAMKRLEEFGGDISKFKVVKLYPNEAYQIGITKTEPGDENNQDISTLVGKVDIRKLEHLSQDDPDAYNYSGGLCKANQGLLEFVEMFKAPIKMLHPLLTATQEGNYKGTEAIPAIPFDGLILAHSNEAEWDTFSNDKNNEAFLDRISVVKVPYCLRVNEEIEIYKKLIRNSKLKNSTCAPGTLEMLAQCVILSRLDWPQNAKPVAKMRVYNGENVKDKFPGTPSLQEFKEMADPSEGFEGMSTRQAFKILSKVFNYDVEEVAANPVHMLVVLTDEIKEHSDDVTAGLAVVEDYLLPEFLHNLRKDIQTAFLDSYDDYGQNLFDRYVIFAEHYLEDKDYRDPDTGQMLDRDALNEELEKLEKPANISGHKDFRAQVVRFCLKHQASNNGKNPSWTSYNKIREVLEKNMFSHTEELLPIIAFSGKGDKTNKDKHKEFVKRMVEKGYTPKQVKLVVDWFIKHDHTV